MGSAVKTPPEFTQSEVPIKKKENNVKKTFIYRIFCRCDGQIIK